MTRIHLTLGLLTLLCPGIEAQTANLRANIPFDFQFGKVLMPAGQYEIQCAAGTHVLWLRETHGQQSAAMLTVPASRSETSDGGVLKFNRYGNEYFLAGVWGAQERSGRGVVKSSREKELAARVRGPEPTVIALRK